MFEFVLAAPNTAFAVAIAVMLGLAALEIVTTLVGFSLSSVVDDALPDFEGAAVDTDIDADVDVAADGVSGLGKILDWFYVGKVPALILLVMALTAFGLVGYGIQGITQSVTGGLMNGLAASAVAFFVSLPVIRGLAGTFARLVPKETTDAVSIDTLVGKTAVITLGVARPGSPAEAKTQDDKGLTHYVRVEPSEDGAAFEKGAEVLLVKRAGTVFEVVAR